MLKSEFPYNNEVLIRFAAVNFMDNYVYAGASLSKALSDAASRSWGDPPAFYSYSTLKRWFYRYQEGGVNGLCRKIRSDCGLSRCISGKVQKALLDHKRETPYIPIPKIARGLDERGVIKSCSVSRSTLYRLVSTEYNQKKPTCKKKESDSRSHLGTLWLLKVLQGVISADELCDQLAPHIAPDIVYRLRRIILTNSLRKRNKYLVILGHFKGIYHIDIASALYIGRSTVGRYVKRFLSDGITGLITQERKKGRKLSNQKYKDTLFSILHAPPSDYGFNRTTWREVDLKEVMQRKGLPISINYIARIIRDAGYKFYKAKKRLTSNDPEYRKKLLQITGILSNLKENEKFFSIDEFGQFSVRMVGGRHLAPNGEPHTIPQYQKSKGSLICTAALELSTSQIIHFFSEKKNTDEMVKPLHILLHEYLGQTCIYLLWDAASWHISRKLYNEVENINNDVRDGRRSKPA